MKKIIALLLIAVVIFSMAACGLAEKAIVGTWKNQNTILGVVTETRYTFNEDGTGRKSALLDISFTYTMEDGELTITTETLGIKTKEVYTYKLKGDTLILTNDAETLTLEKVD